MHGPGVRVPLRVGGQSVKRPLDLRNFSDVQVGIAYPVLDIFRRFAISDRTGYRWLAAGKLKADRHPVTGDPVIWGETVLAILGDWTSRAYPAPVETRTDRR